MNDCFYLHIANNKTCNVSFDSNVAINNIYKDKNTTTIKTNKKELYCYITPFSSKNKTYLPYAEKINLEEINRTNHIKIIPFRNNHFELRFSLLEAPNLNPADIIAEEYFGKLNIVILNNSCGNILFYENSKLKKQLTCDSVITAEINQIQNKIIIKCLLNENSYYIAILNIENLEVLKELNCNSFEENKNEIKCLTKLNDFAKHALISSFNYLDEKEDFYNVYLNEKPATTDCQLLIPYAFLDAIKVRNYNLARYYLFSNLNNVSDSHLESFFGKIKNIYLDSYNLETFKIPYVVENTDGFENVDFIIENNKIKEIIK